MSTLADESISLARKGDPALDSDEASQLLASLPGWEIVKQEGIDQLRREYRFKDYLMIVDLAHKIGCMAEQVDHHPLMVIEWGKLTVTWWTHTLDGLHRNDFIMAARCDRVAMLISAP